jgi:hypothetical protein
MKLQRNLHNNTFEGNITRMSEVTKPLGCHSQKKCQTITFIMNSTDELPWLPRWFHQLSTMEDLQNLATQEKQKTN